jgi:hypothetical protein
LPRFNKDRPPSRGILPDAIGSVKVWFDQPPHVIFRHAE